MSKKKIILWAVGIATFILIIGYIIFSISLSKSSQEIIDDSNKKISYDPETAIIVLDEIIDDEKLEIDTEQISNELEKTVDEYLDLDLCQLDKVYSVDLDLGFLENYGIMSENVVSSTGGTENIGELLNSLIQKEVQYILYERGSLDSTVEGVSAEAGVILLELEKPEISPDMNQIYLSNLKVIQNSLACS